MNNRRNSSFGAVLIAAAALAATQAASAQVGVAVSYRDLDLTQPQGVTALKGRLRAAARTVCGAPERGEVAAHFARRDCYARSIAQAIRGLEADRQLVAALRP